MREQEERNVQCPYCGEMLEVVLDFSVPHQRYIEVCQVCCRPINFDVTVVQDGEATVVVSRDGE